MKGRQLAEIRALVAGGDFTAWLDALTAARAKATASQQAHEAQLEKAHLQEFRSEAAQRTAADKLYRAGELEDLAETSRAEAEDLENRALEVLGEFETQRVACSELWTAMTAAEQEVEAGIKDRASESRLKKLRDDYAAGTARKNRTWETVEEHWAASAEKSLAKVEFQLLAKAVRKESEALFAASEEARKDAVALRGTAAQAQVAGKEAAHQVEELLAQGRARFAGWVHDALMYWPQHANNKMMFLVPLVDDAAGFNLELRAGHIYQVHKDRGVEFIEPVVEARRDAADPRLDDFFLKGRPTSRATPPGEG